RAAGRRRSEASIVDLIRLQQDGHILCALTIPREGAGMKRLAYALVLILLAGGTWRAVDNFRMKPPVSGAEITVPGHNGPNALLVSGWKTTPAGRHLPSGDM